MAAIRELRNCVTSPPSVLALAAHLATGAARRASSGTSEYLGFMTPPTKPSSPDTSFNAGSPRHVPTSPPSAQHFDSEPDITPTSSMSSSVAAMSLENSSNAPAPSNPSSSAADAPIAWQSKTSPASNKRAVGKSRFCNS